MSEEKRRIENKLSTLEEDLEEEQTNSEAAIDKARKAEQQTDVLSNENSQLQANLQKAESTKSQLEKQVGMIYTAQPANLSEASLRMKVTAQC